MAMIKTEAWRCDECGYVWLKKTNSVPERCPKRGCRSRLWDSKRLSFFAPPGPFFRVVAPR
jgi:hypothetical protein